MEAMGMMRDLDQIRERDDARESSKLVVISLCGLAAACVLFAVGVMIGREGDSTRASRREDPLARLDALAGQVADAGGVPVTYPERLVDPPAANAATAAATATPTPAQPQELRAAANVPVAALVDPTGRVREALPAAAQLPASQYARLSPAPTNAAPVPSGTDGAYTLQVSSFRAPGPAQVLAQRLRERGHHAFVASGLGANSIQWHRVRIGPFPSQREADRYRSTFEARERMPTFVVRRDSSPSSER